MANDADEEPDFSVGSRMNLGFQSSLIKERDTLKAENAKLREALKDGEAFVRGAMRNFSSSLNPNGMALLDDACKGMLKALDTKTEIEWRELQVGERVKKGDEGRWPDGERIEVPPHFYGKEVKVQGIYFRPVRPSSAN